MDASPDTVPTVICSDINVFESEIEKTSEIFADICQLVFSRGRTMTPPSINQCDSPCTWFNVSLACDGVPEKSGEVSLHTELRRIGYTGNPIIIEFLLLPMAEIENNGWSFIGKHIPAYLVEQWMIQFLPKRLVAEAIFDMPSLLKDIKSYCDSSLVNKLLFKSENLVNIATFNPLCCVCRLTNLLGANLFSSCWFALNTTDLIIERPKISSADFNFRLIRDLSDSFPNSEGVHTTTRTKCPKRNYLCNNPCSHVHRKDTAGICVSKSLSRIVAGSREVLDTMVTSVLEMPTIPPSDNIFKSLRYLLNGAMSLPTKRCSDMQSPNAYINTCDDNAQRNTVPKSPVVIMSQWSESTTFFLSPPPCKLKRLQQASQRPQLEPMQPLEQPSAKPQVEECINQFTSLSVQQRQTAHANKSPTQTELCAPNTDDYAKWHFPLICKTKNSKSFSEDFSPDSVSFNMRTGLPLRSSPIPVKQKNSTCFDFDASLVNSHDANGDMATSKTSRPTTLALKRRPSSRRVRTISASASLGGNNGGGVSSPGTPLPPPSFSQLLINFEESMLNGRIAPAGVVEGFSVSLGASGAFFPAHVKLPMIAYFFRFSEDGNTSSPYLGHVDLTRLSNKRGYRVPKKGSIQLTLFNPSQSVMKVFVIQYNLEDMPANSQTFLRQRTVYMPVSSKEAISSVSKQSSELSPRVFKNKRNLSTSKPELPAFLRYLVHLRFHTTKSASLYLHTDIRLIFARDANEFDPCVATYQMLSFIEGPTNPRFSPKTC